MSDDDDSLSGDSSSRRGGGGDNSQIEVYGRIRPSPKNDKNAAVLLEDHRSMEFRVPKDILSGSVNNKKDTYTFRMEHIFAEDATQAQVFDGIGKKVVMNCMEGFNGTIFAYGQTGSGKTFSITGGPDRYEDRGLIPRTLSLIFELAAERAATHAYSISISYLEIYNDDGYDLLDAAHERKSLSELPKVAMYEDELGQVHMRNIHCLPVASVDEALNLLFVGDTNRVICETPSNDASSRSHCIFTIYMERREVGGATIRRSKLHLVDLAGSERVKKCWGLGTQLRMWDGSVRSVEEIAERSMAGEAQILIGDDSLPRLVVPGSEVRGHTAADADCFDPIPEEELAREAAWSPVKEGHQSQMPSAFDRRFHCKYVGCNFTSRHRSRRDRHERNAALHMISPLPPCEPATYRIESAHPGREPCWTCNGAHALVLQLDEQPSVRLHDGHYRVRVWTLQQDAHGIIHPTLSWLPPHFSHTRDGRRAAQQLKRQWSRTHAQPQVFEITAEEFVRSYSPAQQRVCKMFSPALVQFAPLVDTPEQPRSLETRLAAIMRDAEASTCDVHPSAELVNSAAHMLGRWIAAAGKPQADVFSTSDDAPLLSCDSAVAGVAACVALPCAVNVKHTLFSPIQLHSLLHPLLLSYGVHDNARFPADLLRESASVRRAVLSGIISAGGALDSSSGTATVTASDKQLLVNVRSLAVSLGCTATAIDAALSKEQGAEQHVLRVAGELISQLLCSDSSKPRPSHSCRNDTLSSRAARFTLTRVDHAAYIGFELSGGSGNRRCLLADGTVTHNTAIAGKILTEALHINLALHYLEQVIVALHKRTKDKNVHIPYRNSMMTSVLKDSLGGNCKTVMIATLSGQRGHVDESISTCRFAARVAMVRNNALLNEEIDPALLVRKLKAQVRELKEELASLRGEKGPDRPCDETDLERCRQMVHEYISTENPPAMEQGIPNPRKVEACFAVFKNLLLAAQQQGNGAANGGGGGPVAVGSAAVQGDGATAGAGGKGSRRLHPSVVSGGSGVNAVQAVGPTDEEIKKLRLMVSSRDNEIGILVSLLREQIAPGKEQEALLRSVRDRALAQAREQTGIIDVRINESGALQQSLLHSKGVQQIQAMHAERGKDDSNAMGASVADDALQLQLRLKSFEDFRKSYRKNQLIEEQKDALRTKISQVHRLGEGINSCREAINKTKNQVEQRRVARGLEHVSAGGSTEDVLPPDEIETGLLSQIDASKANYRSQLNQLKELKAEVEHLKALIERSRRKLQADFDVFWAEQQKVNGGGGAGSGGGSDGSASNRSRTAGSAGSTSTSAGLASPLSGTRTMSFPVQQASPASSPSSSPPPPGSARGTVPTYAGYGSGRGGAAGGSNSLIGGSAAIAQQQAPPRPHSRSSSSSAGPAAPVSYSSGSSAAVPASAARLPSTGNAQADADIAKFYAMRDALMKQQQQQRQ